MLTAANQTWAADTPPRVKSGAPLPTKAMQLTDPSSNYDAPPKFISGVAPEFRVPPRVVPAPGYAVIDFTIAETGRTRDFRVVETSAYFLASDAIYTMKKWRFQPATKHGRPVACRARIPFRFGKSNGPRSGASSNRWPP
jgi:TonB family protein